MRNYGNLKDIDKPLVVSGILLALNEIEHKNFTIDNLNGDTEKTDGQKIYDAIKANLKRVKVAPDVKRDKILSQFSIIKDTTILNEPNKTLGKTPLKYYTELFCELVDLKADDVVLDPCCGTAGFLIAALYVHYKEVSRIF